MKIISTSDWHLGNLFHGNDRLPEHRHFLNWLLDQITTRQPDALLVAGDIFDNGNPSAAAQHAYYEFLAEAIRACQDMTVVITAGNHDSSNRLEAPRPLLERYNVEIRGNVRRTWVPSDDEEGASGSWQTDYDDLIIPIQGRGGDSIVVLAVPYLRSDVVADESYSHGVNRFLRQLTDRARQLYPDKPTVMMAHLYAHGTDIADNDASEKIIIGGQEEVNIDKWEGHPDYMTCGHIHKRQRVWGTDWARYTGSALPMSFAEKDYRHGVDLLTIGQDRQPEVEFVEYRPQHPLRVLPEGDEALPPKKLQKLIVKQLADRQGDKPSEAFEYVERLARQAGARSHPGAGEPDGHQGRRAVQDAEGDSEARHHNHHRLAAHWQHRRHLEPRPHGHPARGFRHKARLEDVGRARGDDKGGNERAVCRQLITHTIEP